MSSRSDSYSIVLSRGSFRGGAAERGGTLEKNSPRTDPPAAFGAGVVVGGLLFFFLLGGVAGVDQEAPLHRRLLLSSG